MAWGTGHGKSDHPWVAPIHIVVSNVGGSFIRAAPGIIRKGMRESTMDSQSWAGIIFCESFNFYRLLVQTITGIDCMLLTLGANVRLGILLIFQQLSSTVDAFYELAKVVSHVGLETLRLNILEEFSRHTSDALLGQAQNFIALLTVMALSQIVTG